ncbi:putative bromodomain-containing protein 10 [Mantella aurantiaca]
MSLLRIEEKFFAGQYRAIDQFVDDFRSMLEGCYRLHGADHWLSKQAQKLEIMLEQKLALLPRNLRDRALSTGSTKSLCGVEEDKGSECTLTRRRSSARHLASVNSGAMESVMVQVLKQAEFLRAKEEKRLKEQERKEAEEASQKEMDEWDKNLLALAAPSCMETMWEIPAIGHFLCLAQQILNLPEIVFYELERCLLMPQCNVFLAKIMTSLLSPPHRRPTLNRRPNLSYRAWEAGLRQKVQQWYTVTGQADNPEKCAEKLGLCSQFFKVLGEVNPLEQKTFHELAFQQKVWLLKGLCDFVYETQSEVQDSVLGQPIHECREVILGYDAQENAYIHFPQFCGADVRVYKQKPLKAPEFPIPSIKIKKIPRARCRRSKCKYPKKNNGQLKIVKPATALTSRTSVELHDDCSLNYHLDSCVSSTKLDVKTVRQYEDQSSCNINKPASCKENVEKPSSPGELVGYGEPLSPGEIRILENVDKYSNSTLPKTDTSPLKENALKTFQVHMNGNHTNNTEVFCHRVAVDIILDHSALNHEKLKLRKLRAKKKKKKKKIRDLLAENTQGRYENFQNTFRSFKADMHNKLFLNKKRAKHKKHRSGKKSLSTNMIVKKRKSAAASPSTPEFQLVCTNLDELRELVKKIDGELKAMESNKKKSGKWHLRRQGVKELHGTLTRLLNELLPWEPKLLKAFQKNRTRLRKDYDDFRRMPESENFTRESSSRGGCEPSKPPISVPKSSELCHKEIKENESFDEQEHNEPDICGKGKMSKKECISKYLSKSQTRNSKRLFRLVDEEDKGILAQKNIKLSTPEISSTSTEEETPSNNCVSNDLQKMEVEVLEMNSESIGASPLSVYKGPQLAEALLAKNIGNKMTLTSQLSQTISNPVPCSESIPTSPNAQNPVKSPLSCQTPLKAPMQMIYKLPDGQCVPVDLQNSSVKIQMQPVIDAKTGDRLMQQVLVLPKNLFIKQKDDRTPNVNQPMQSDVAHQNCAFNVPLSSSIADQTGSKATSLALSKGILCSTKSSTLPVSQPPVSTFASSTSMSTCKTSKNSTPDYLACVMSSNYGQSLPGKSDFGPVTSSTGNPTMAIQMANSSSVLQKDISEAKQELRTVCIRDSQSILVRTRGGNTGVVKVQPSQDPGTSVIPPNPIFTFTPQLQSFLVSRTNPSATTTFTPVTTSHTQPVFSSACVGRNQVSESNTNWAQVQQPAPRATIQAIGNPIQPNFLPIVSQASTCPTNSVISTNTAAGTITPYSCCGTGQDCSVVRKAGIDLKQTEPKVSSASVVQPDSTTPSKSDFVSGSSIHQVMLLTAPSIHPPGTSPNMGIVSSPALAQIPSKKFVFINTQIPTSSSSTNMTSLTSKQTTNTNIGKTFVRPPEQPQVFLIPSTIATPIKMSSPPIVSQVKDVKIGLTIGQTIVNNAAGMKNILPINILQNPLAKGDECIWKDSTVSTAPPLSKVHNEQVTSSNIKCDYTVASTKGSMACAVGTSANTGQYSATERKGNDFLRTLSSVSSRLPTASSGSTVAISTVKTGHLSSSVLLSTNLMTEQITHASSLLQRPISSTLPGTNSSLGATPIASTYQPALMEQSENTKSITQSIHKVVSTNVTKQPPVTMPSSLLPPLCKTGPWHASSQALPPLSASTVNQVRPQMNESSAHHKLVINTSTPLAPGTQITINGTRFIVPPQGLGVGSHVLLLSTNAKQGPSLTGSSQACHGSPLVSTTAPQPALKQNISPTQYPVQTFKCTTAPDMSTSLPNVQPASRIVNVTSSDFSPFSLSSMNKPSSTTALQPLLVPYIQRGSYPQQTNMAPLTKGTPVTETVNLNTASPPGNLLPASTMLGSKRADADSFRLQSSTADKPHTVAT